MPEPERPRTLTDWLGLSDAPNWWVARPLGPLVTFVLSLLILGAVAAAFRVLGNAITGAEVGLGSGGLIVAVLGAPFLIWTTWLKHRTVEFQKEGHMTDRISKAVEQLGAEKTVKKVVDGKTVETTEPNLEVRIGAILSLERIAQDSTRHDKGRDHVRVMEILCAYIRHNAPASGAKDHGFGEWEPLADDSTAGQLNARESTRKARFEKVANWVHALPPPRADIAEALKVIGRRTPAQMRVEAAWPNPPDAGTIWPFDQECPALADAPGEAALTRAQWEAYRAKLDAWRDRVRAYGGYRIDLRATNLQKADLAAASLQAARLDGARMEGANLGEARMEGADLREARMDGANLKEARLEGADLWRTRMERADLGGARMERVELLGARMEGALLRGARMVGAYLGRARLEGADLSEARMEGALLREARLERAKLWEARMEGADLEKARMEWADLWRARMEGAHLRAARMEGAFLREARMEGANLREARMEAAYLWSARMDASTALNGTSLVEVYLRSVDLSGVAITLDQIKSAFGDASVVLPQGLNPGHLDWPDHWPVWALPDDGPNGFSTQWLKWRADPATYTPPPPP